VISDTHVGGPNVSAARMRKIVARMNAEKPDIVVLLGDYPNKRYAERWRKPAEKVEIESGIASFAGLKAPLGVYGVIGNNDSRYGADRMRSFLERANVTVLQNESVMAPASRFYIAGIDDLQARRADVPKALSRIPQGASAITIMHIPDSFAEIPSSVALSLAGHSHCGQIGLPLAVKFINASEGSKVWRCHLYVDGGRYLYVSGGIGESVLPMRFMAPPEINIVTLRGQDQAK
jgi:predicted MPP superfamily phosphohydrolase